MIKRLTRSLMVLFVTLLALGAYRLLAVPFIEPVATRQETKVTSTDNDWTQRVQERQRRDLAGWFPEGSWQLDKPLVLETDRAKLVFREYKNLPDGRVLMTPCTMIFLPADVGLSDEDRRRRAVILEAPQGAQLLFDEPLELQRANIGKLIGAKIDGEITLRSDYRAPGPADDLHVATRNLAMSDAEVTTSEPVEFHLGENRGSGRGLRIELLPAPKPSASKAPSVGGIKSFSLLSEVQLQLQVAAGGMMPGRQEAPATPEAETTPMNVTCRGPLEFDAVKHVLQFNQDVEVLRMHVDAQPDEVRGDVLRLELMPAPGPDGAPAPAPAGGFKAPKLVAQRIEVRGDVVTLRAPSSEVDAAGQRLEYNFVTGEIGLRSLQTAQIRYQRSEIHAPEIYYRPDPARKVGHFLARGAGWLRGFLPGDDPQQVEARWAHELRLYPDAEQQAPAYVLSARGEANLNAVGLGSLSGNEIHAWLLEAPPQFSPTAPVDAAARLAVAGGMPVAPQAPPPGSSAFRLVPDKLLAVGNVKVDAPQLLCDVQRLELWFENLPLTAPALQPADAAGPVAGLPGAAAPQPAGAAGPLAPPGEPAAPPQRIQVAGGMLQAKVLVRGPQTQLVQLVIEKDVSVREVGPRDPAQPPFVVEGQHVHVDQSDPARAEVTVTGEPAHIEARGLVLDGAQIHMQQAANLMWIEGAGHMILPVDRDLEGQPSATPQQLDLTWAGKMRFDGQTAVFERDVVARLNAQTLRTAMMEVLLTSKVDFRKPNETRPELERLTCTGGVTIESREFAANKPTSVVNMTLGDLSIEQRSGDIRGRGPGRLVVWRAGGDDLRARFAGAGGLPVLGGGGAPRPPAAAAGAEDAKGDELTFLGVDFQGGLTGNLHRRTTSFNSQVRVVYGPVASWGQEINPDDTAQLGDSGIVLNCQQLTATQVVSPAGDRRTAELVASGNPVVEGQRFTARAQQITYVELKDVLTLTGSGQQLAELHEQGRPGSLPQRLAAGTILYRPSTREVQVDNAQFLDLNQIPGRPR